MITELYYYNRDNIRTPRVAVCLLIDDFGAVAKGVSICSFNETPLKSKGREASRGRAYFALHKKENCSPINRHEAFQVLGECFTYDDLIQVHGSEFPRICLFKGIYKPILNKYETIIVERELAIRKIKSGELAPSLDTIKIDSGIRLD